MIFAPAQRMRTWLILLATYFTGCTSVPTLPPISATEQYVPGKIVWHDLVTYDVDSAKRFYGELFGWKFEEVARGYSQIRNGDRLIGGIARLDSKDKGTYWIPLMSVADIDQSAEKVRNFGGKMLREPFEIPGRGKIALVTDQQGSPFGMVRALKGDPLDLDPQTGDWLWNEVWTSDPNSAATFYKNIGGYQEASRNLFGKPYRYLKGEGKPRLGLVKKPDPSMKNTWACYIKVANPAAIADRAAALGGRVLFAPKSDVRNATVAIIQDPTGAALVVQKWPVE